MKTITELIVEYGAVSYSPPPLRMVKGVSFTFDQLTAFAEAYHAQKEAEKWISVDDGLPEKIRDDFSESDYILVFTKSGQIHKTTVRYYDKPKCHVFVGCGENQVTYWQPLPPLPISKDGE